MHLSTTVDASTPGPGAGLDVLILDDDELDRKRMRRLLMLAGVKGAVIDTDSLAGFSEALASSCYDAVLIDYRLGTANGIEALNLLRANRSHRSAAAIMVTGDQRIDLAVEAMRFGCDDFVTKGALDVRRLGDTLNRAIRHRKEGRPAALHAPSPVMALRNAVEQQTTKTIEEVRRALSSVATRTRKLREGYADDPVVLSEASHIDAACARAWQKLNNHMMEMDALDLTRPRLTRLGLRKRHLH